MKDALDKMLHALVVEEEGNAICDCTECLSSRIDGVMKYNRFIQIDTVVTIKKAIAEGDIKFVTSVAEDIATETCLHLGSQYTNKLFFVSSNIDKQEEGYLSIYEVCFGMGRERRDEQFNIGLKKLKMLSKILREKDKEIKNGYS